MRSAAGTACCCAVELLIDWIVVPCFVSVVSRTSRSTPLPLVVSNDITHVMVHQQQNCRVSIFMYDIAQRILNGACHAILQKVH